MFELRYMTRNNWLRTVEFTTEQQKTEYITEHSLVKTPILCTEKNNSYVMIGQYADKDYNLNKHIEDRKNVLAQRVKDFTTKIEEYQMEVAEAEEQLDCLLLIKKEL